MNILFLTLRVFSATGGIEKVCRLAGRALHLLADENANSKVTIFSMYDEDTKGNELYFPSAIFKGFGKKKVHFISAAVKKGINNQFVILSHVNLLMVGFLIKLIAPKTKLVLIAHGIEVWRIFPQWKKMMLNKIDLILPVSEFTKQQMMELYNIPANKMTVLNNCIDPFLPLPLKAKKNIRLMQLYGINEKDTVLFTLTRMAAGERYKGYDQVIQAVYDLKHIHPSIKYLIVGKYDAIEKARLDEIITHFNLKDNIILAGFIPDSEIAVHFNLSDIYIMPSQKEGFGIVFIEALYYGKPVIAGNADGSVDALKNGTFGLLVNPINQQEITDAIVEVITNKQKYIPDSANVKAHFGFNVYKEKLQKIIKFSASELPVTSS